MSNTVIIIGVLVQIMTLGGIVFVVGRFTGRTTNIVENMQKDISEIKADMKTHVANDTAGFRDLTKDVNDVKLSIERLKRVDD